ncbi:MAG: hypothetical protein J3K34DRAFT_375685 [Monoraphidium minutum]|nr:MAG: hypothetical protein J3K34DRAFT_375685 [Monoraphidium minutum]
MRWRRRARAPISRSGAPQVRGPRMARDPIPVATNGLPKAASGSGAARKKRAAGGGKVEVVPEKPGPLAKLKPSPNCVPLADGNLAVVRRPIAADHSCLFNSVGYCMHHSKSRAPFLRRVVSNEVSGDPDTWSPAFLGMSNAAYCAWINEPQNWGGGIELAILAAHYRREIAAWNAESGEPHVFGEEAGYSKQVMVIYNGVHYDALAVTARPNASSWEEDITEFNPRTRRGKMILEAARTLVKLNSKNFVSPSKTLKAAAVAMAAAAASATGPAAAGQEQQQQQQPALGRLKCSSCAVEVVGQQAAAQHARDTGHTEWTQV